MRIKERHAEHGEALRVHGVKVISDRVALNKNQIDTVFSILYDYRFTTDSTLQESAACYNPRHAILFYKNDKLIEYLEICFECQRIEHIDKKTKLEVMCFDKWCFLSEYFKHCGMTRYLSEGATCKPNPYSKK